MDDYLMDKQLLVMNSDMVIHISILQTFPCLESCTDYITGNRVQTSTLNYSVHTHMAQLCVKVQECCSAPYYHMPTWHLYRIYNALYWLRQVWHFRLRESGILIIRSPQLIVHQLTNETLLYNPFKLAYIWLCRWSDCRARWCQYMPLFSGACLCAM